MELQNKFQLAVAPCNIVGFVKTSSLTSVARQVAEKVEPLSTSATVAVEVKTRVCPSDTTLLNWCRKVLLCYAG